MREFPEYYRWYSQREFTWNKITQANRNGLLYRDPTVDGIKTGHTDTAGYCLVSSAKRGDMRLISVVLGTVSMKAREDASQALLNYGYNFYRNARSCRFGARAATDRPGVESRSSRPCRSACVAISTSRCRAAR